MYSQFLSNNALEGFGDFKIGQAIHTVKYADDLVLLDKEEVVLQSMMGGVTKTGRHYGMEMNVGKTKMMRISRQSSTIQTVIDHKHLENVEYLNNVSSMTTVMQDVHLRLNPGLPWQKQHSTRRRLFSQANWT